MLTQVATSECNILNILASEVHVFEICLHVLFRYLGNDLKLTNFRPRHIPGCQLSTTVLSRHPKNVESGMPKSATCVT